MDLWSFDTETLKSSIGDLPNNILKEQADILSQKTEGTVYGTMTNMKFEPLDDKVKYNLATLFEVVVPNLDNYRYTLLILYSRPESDYPVAISVGSSPIADAENFSPLYECGNKKEFIDALTKILSSDEINKNIEVLYSKAHF